MKNARNKEAKKSFSDYNAVKRILAVGDVEKLIKKQKTEEEPTLYFVTNEEL